MVIKKTKSTFAYQARKSTQKFWHESMKHWNGQQEKRI